MECATSRSLRWFASGDDRMLMIARHGQTVMNVGHCVGGPVDSPLTPAGVTSALLIGHRLAALAGEATPVQVRCSPMGRAMVTCALICEALPQARVCVEPRIAAVDSGAFNGLPAERIAVLRSAPLEVIMNTHDWFFQGPGGETFDMVWDRCRAALSDLPPGVNLLVTHGLPARLLRCIAMGLKRSQALELKHPQSAVSLLSGDLGACNERMLDVAAAGMTDISW